MRISSPSPRLAAAGFLLAFLVQAGLVSAMVADRATILSRGREVRLPVVPVDPRDLFRGDYVVLSYPFSSLELAKLDRSDPVKDGQTVFVTLVRDGEAWRAARLSAAHPGDGLVLQARVTARYGMKPDCPACGSVTLAYGLEKFFVPEGKGRAVERERDKMKVEVDAAVSSDGRAVLRRLIVDGVPRFEDTLL